MKEKIILFLDLDGVLITTPSWKKDELAADGYSKFNDKCIEYLNVLLSKFDLDIYLSSTRRATKTIEEFNAIFNHRNIATTITAFLPENSNYVSRGEEIENFIQENQLIKYLIIDDDKSLMNCSSIIKENVVLTNYYEGFNAEKLREAIEMLVLRV